MHLCQGQRDIELNLKGRLEAKRLTELLNEFSFSQICVSPLKRALETAQIIHEAFPITKLHIIDELKERDWGELEGVSSEKMYFVEEMEEKDYTYHPQMKIEPRQTFKKRILQGMNHALQWNDPLIVSHGRCFLILCELLNVPIIRQISNTRLIECSPSEKGWRVILH